MSDESTSKLRADKQRLFAAVLVIAGIALALLSLALGTYLALWSSKPELHEVLAHWLESVLVGTASGIVVVAIVTSLGRLYGIRESESDSLGAEIQDAGIVRVYKNWSQEMPATTEMRQLFVAADVVHIAAITFFRSMIGNEWFSGALADRIKANRETRLMLLDPDGSEITRREKEGRRLQPLSREAVSSVTRGLRAAGVDESRTKEYLRLFDFALGSNYVRLGDTAFLVMFAYGAGGNSPGARLVQRGWLAASHGNAFTNMWNSLA